MTNPTRRKLLSALGAATLAFGFDARRRRWVAHADADSGCAAVPPLDGALVLDGPELAACARDAGYHVTRHPWAVLYPGSAADLARMIEYCRCYGIPIAARGQGHTTHGQSLVDGGVIVRTETLSEIHEIGPDYADVGAGVLWNELLEATLAHGLAAPVHTGFLGLSIGGTLSMGGVPTTPQRGYQVDRVRAIEVVTGRGEILWCSPTEHPDLFDGVLGGLGQLGIITRAMIDLVSAPARVASWVLRYLDPHRFFADMKTLIERQEAESVFARIAPPGPTALPEPPAAVVEALGPTAGAFNLVTPALSPLLMLLTGLLSKGPGLWVYQIVVSKELGPGEQASPAHLLRGMGDLALARTSSNQTFSEYTLRVDALVELLETLSLWHDVPHPWCDVFLPASAVEGYVTATMKSFHYDDVGTAGLALILPMKRGMHVRPQPSMPASSAPDEIVYMFGIETTAPGPGPNAAFVAEKLARNRALYEQARAVGGTLYPHCAVTMTPADWAAQHGAYYAELAALKAYHDPDGILTPGPNVFPP